MPTEDGLAISRGPPSPTQANSGLSETKPPCCEPRGKKGAKKEEWQRRKGADGGNLSQLLASMNKENQSRFGKDNICKDLARIIVKRRNALNVVEITHIFPLISGTA